ncbi:MAG: hypothetical protein A3F84_27745 [Candidatus Handelsmanbacteria bacterium RIFCSPLOWO2_12_FULL_64_10]|uniref:Phage gp6-like head-tail connector protein n=1 Tax=Handelsmanbacteria sp. (strain RIFCSPLOWO2_12_FULL_64_10) TaxID=1817868 RepID=A0A1F6C5F9_HANXR|nr:MAG: hypothetical protein A3F84_27745 [Candidatus Handelsmanbacteria bacterium RIFCSPLOWO2_12_FULL_64_10]
MPYGLRQTVAPGVEPIDLAVAKLHCRDDVTENETTLTALIAAARRHVERWTSRQLITATWAMTLDEFPSGDDGTDNGEIRVPISPLIAVTSITYVDSDGDTQTLATADYQVDARTEPGRIRPVYGEVWPATRPDTMAAVTVTFTAGYGTAASDVPDDIKAAIKLLISHLNEHREAVSEISVNELPLGVKSLLSLNDVAEYV